MYIWYCLKFVILSLYLFHSHPILDNDTSVLQFYGCNEGVDATGKSCDIVDTCGEFKRKAHPVFFIISTVFLIITLFVYLAEDSLRYNIFLYKRICFLFAFVFRGSNVLFSRITMGFIINLTIALILFTIGAMKQTEDRETVGCEAKAYITLYCFLVSIYTFLKSWRSFSLDQPQPCQSYKNFKNFSLIKAFYCWMNAMCFNIWNKFASMQRQSLDDRRKFIRLIFQIS